MEKPDDETHTDDLDLIGAVHAGNALHQHVSGIWNHAKPSTTHTNTA